MELADTSAWTNRHKDPAVEADFDQRVLADEIAICQMVVMELLWTTRSEQELGELRQDLSALPQIAIAPATWDRAIDVWHELARRGGHRQAKIQDLLVAAAAELAGVPVCHYDSDFVAIAAITGQQERAIAPIGTL